jgi:CRP-like cAMP-binding protein
MAHSVDSTDLNNPNLTDPQPLIRTTKYLHPKAKEIIVQLCFSLPPHEIASYLDLHPRTVERIWKRYKRTGTVVQAPGEAEKVGRPRTVDWTHGLVSF